MTSRISLPRLLCGTGFRVLLLLLCVFASAQAFAQSAIPSGHIRIHYFRPDGNYSGSRLSGKSYALIVQSI
jgi:hypothetical protein